MMRWTLTLALAAASACSEGTGYQLKGTEVSPGADAVITANIDNERSVTSLALEAKNLAPPERVLDGATTYVVWARSEPQEPWLRLGALAMDDDGRGGKASLTVAKTTFELIVTAEPDAEAPSPSDKRVFKHQIGSGEPSS